jgi:hypothetical protein
MDDDFEVVFELFLLLSNIKREMRQKSNKRLMSKTIIGETKREGQRKAKKHIACKKPKKKMEKLIPFVVGSYFTHGPSNVACMQIMRSNSSGRLRTSITCQHNLPLYRRIQSTT